MATLDPAANPKSYDSFILAGQKSPGVCRFSFPTREFGWDQQQAKNTDGAETVLNGAKLAEFEAEITLWRDYYVDHYAAWDKWKPILATPVQQGANKALDIYHPQLEGLGIKSVVVKTRTEPQSAGPGGHSIVKIKFLEYAPSKKKTGTGKPGGSKGAGGTGPNANGPKAETNLDLKEQIADNTALINRQAQGEQVSSGEVWRAVRR